MEARCLLRESIYEMLLATLDLIQKLAKDVN